MAAVTQVRILVTASRATFCCTSLYGESEDKKYASAGNRTRINCLEGSYADHYTTDADISICLLDIHPKLNYNKLPPGDNVLFALDPMLNQLLVFYHFNMSGGYSSVVEQSAAVR